MKALKTKELAFLAQSFRLLVQNVAKLTLIMAPVIGCITRTQGWKLSFCCAAAINQLSAPILTGQSE